MLSSPFLFSSGDEHEVCRQRDYTTESSEDEFERAMEAEVMGAMKLLTSPTALRASGLQRGERRNARIHGDRALKGEGSSSSNHLQ